ncbi:MAG: hypothetical protein ACI3WR_03975 [Oscillospiraceae bacterium]
MGKGIVINIPPMEQPKTYAIAYLDLLGTTSKISNDEKGLYLNRLRAIYNMAVQYSENEALAKSCYSGIQTKIFSDNIIMAIPLASDDDAAGVSCLLSFAAIFQNYAAVLENWLVRGGVTIGSLFLDRMLVWGSGLVRAYELEDHIAIYPRIVIDRNVLRLCGTESGYFRQDMDGQFYLDFLSFMRYRDAEGRDDFVPAMQRNFRGLLAEIRKPDGGYAERPYQKLQWYKNYINAWYRERHPDVELPPVDEAALS